MKKANQWVNLCFFLVILLFLLAGLARTLFWPKEINYYENRYAYTVEELSSENFLSGTFQDSVEKALSDQVPLAQRLKSQYHRLSVSFQLKTLEGFIKAHPDLYVNFLGNSVFGGNCLVYYPAPLEEKLAVLEPRIENINSMLDRHPELEFYVFYIEKDTDMNFSTGKNTGFSSYVQENLHLDTSHFGLFQVTDFDFFSRNFYKTDHHWNCYGSYLGYTQVAKLLCLEDKPMVPEEEKLLAYTFSGSKANTSGGMNVFKEQFPAYRFVYPDMDITINGEPAEDYGKQDAYWNGETTEQISYGAFYGSDSGEIIFDTHRQDRESILVLGESYDNAILKLLASHFQKTYSVDLRNYEVSMGAPFRLEEYVQAHQISKVLLIGSRDYFLSDDFRLED